MSMSLSPTVTGVGANMLGGSWASLAMSRGVLISLAKGNASRAVRTSPVDSRVPKTCGRTA